MMHTASIPRAPRSKTRSKTHSRACSGACSEAWLRRGGALVLAALAAAPAVAQETSAGPARAAADGPRYAFSPVEGGALKLDTQTGRVSLCAKGPAGFVCEAVPDSRDAYDAEIGRLQEEIAALKRAAGAPPQPDAAPGGPSDLDAALDYAERFYRRLRGFIDDWRAPDQNERL